MFVLPRYHSEIVFDLLAVGTKSHPLLGAH